MRALRITKEFAIENAKTVFFGDGDIPNNYGLLRISKKEALRKINNSLLKKCGMRVMVDPIRNSPVKNSYLAVLHLEINCPGAPDVWLYEPNGPDSDLNFDTPNPPVDGRIESAIKTLQELAPEKLNSYI